VCLRDPACVVWLAPASVAGRYPTAATAGEVTVVRVRDGLEARDTDDGELRWRTDLADAADQRAHLPVLAAGGHALVVDVAEELSWLVAVDLATGEVDWRVRDVAELSDARAHEGTLLVEVVPSVDRERSPPEGVRRGREGRVLALDAGSGEVRWSTGGQLLHLVDDGAVVVTEDTVALHGPDGATVWREPLARAADPDRDGDATADEPFVPAWLDVTGRFLRLYDSRGTASPVLALADGEPVELDGELVPVADLAGSPRDPFRSGLAGVLTRRADGGTDLTLLDGDEAAWRITFDRLGCCAPIQLADERIVVPAADGGRWVVAREDGTVLDRLDPPTERARASAFLPSYGGVTVEELDVAAVTTTELALVEDGRRTALLPAGSWPVGVHDDVIVVRSHGWVAAIRRDRATEPGEDATGGGAGGG
jgi:hypothetical protein